MLPGKLLTGGQKLPEPRSAQIPKESHSEPNERAESQEDTNKNDSPDFPGMKRTSKPVC